MATRKKTKEQKAELARLAKQESDEHTKLIERYGVFCAFNTEQFNEGIDNLNKMNYEGKVCHLGIGMFCRADKVKEFIAEHKALVSKYNKMKKAVSTFETYAKMMFNNYESYYTGEVNDLCMGAILSVYPDKTIEEINAYFNEVRYNITSL